MKANGLITTMDVPQQTYQQPAAEIYWNHDAHTDAEACVLAERLGLHIPSGTLHEKDAYRSLLCYPLRRLIISGEDTPANKALLLGPTWEADTADLHQIYRLEVLRCPLPGSLSHAAATILDEGGTT